MEENKKNVENTALTYEQLQAMASQLSMKVRQLQEQLADQEFFQICKRLDYLFAVLGKDTFFPADFVTACATEIQTLLTPVENPNTDAE